MSETDPYHGDGRLCVKELADGLGVSTRFVYEMRRCGFVMEGVHQAATLKSAVDWIKANDFRMVRGVGRVQKGSNRAA